MRNGPVLAENGPKPVEKGHIVIENAAKQTGSYDHPANDRWTRRYFHSPLKPATRYGHDAVSRAYKFFFLSIFQGSPSASVQAAKSCSHCPLSSAIFNCANVRLPCSVQLIPFFFCRIPIT